MGQESIWTSLLGAAVRYCDAGGMKTRYLEAGDGDPLILMHGSGGHCEAFFRNVLPLGQHFHVYAMDLAGHGLTDRHPTLAGLAGLADHLLRFMDAQGLQKAHLAGESLGGAIAARVALEHPERVDKLIYITGAGLVLGEEWDRLSEPGRQSLQRLSAAATGAPTRESVRERLAWLFVDPEKSITDELVELRVAIYSRRLLQDAEKPGTSPAQGGIDLQLTPERLRQIKSPFFFLWTDHNPTTPAAAAEHAHQQMPGSRYHVIKDAGHWPQSEQTEEFNRVIVEFLKS